MQVLVLILGHIATKQCDKCNKIKKKLCKFYV